MPLSIKFTQVAPFHIQVENTDVMDVSADVINEQGDVLHGFRQNFPLGTSVNEIKATFIQQLATYEQDIELAAISAQHEAAMQNVTDVANQLVGTTI